MDNNRKRVRVACDSCRRKKIRCDGKSRCQNCIASNVLECLYPERNPPVKSKHPSKRELDQRLVRLDSRLDRLEKIILSISDRLPGSEPAPADFKSKTSSSYDHQDITESGTTDSSSDGEIDVSGLAHDRADLSNGNCDVYMGAHTFISILSSNSMNWMKERLGEKNAYLLVPLAAMPYMLKKKSRAFMGRWFKAKIGDEIDLARSKHPLPEKREEMFQLLKQYRGSFLVVHVLYERDEVTTLLTQYYDSWSNPKVKKLSNVQLFKLCLALLYCANDAVEILDRSQDADSDRNSTSPNFSPAELRALRENLLDRCVSYYYQQCITSKDVQTVQALVLLTTFLDKYIVAPDISRMILAHAIRISLDLGLNRIETYRSLSQEQFDTRLKTWQLACVIDLEISFSSGSSPCINYNEMSDELRPDCLLLRPAESPFSAEFYDCYGMIFAIRLQSFNRLFSATAKIKNFAHLTKNVDYLNAEMFSFAEKLSTDYRPLFYDEPGFSALKSVQNVTDEHRLFCRLSFLTHMMAINRIPTYSAPPEVDDAQIAVYRNYSIRCARTIIRYLQEINNRNKFKAFPLWIMYFPVMSALHLSASCMTHPNSPDTHDDLLSIIDMCEHWFTNSIPEISPHDPKVDLTLILELFAKSVLLIAITLFEKNSDKEVLERSAKLLHESEKLRNWFSEFYIESNDASPNRSGEPTFATPREFLGEPIISVTTPNSSTSAIHGNHPGAFDSYHQKSFMPSVSTNSEGYPGTLETMSEIQTSNSADDGKQLFTNPMDNLMSFFPDDKI